jgi:hypothetical protein
VRQLACLELDHGGVALLEDAAEACGQRIVADFDRDRVDSSDRFARQGLRKQQPVLGIPEAIHEHLPTGSAAATLVSAERASAAEVICFFLLRLGRNVIVT